MGLWSRALVNERLRLPSIGLHGRREDFPHGDVRIKNARGFVKLLKSQSGFARQGCFIGDRPKRKWRLFYEPTMRFLRLSLAACFRFYSQTVVNKLIRVFESSSSRTQQIMNLAGWFKIARMN
jgi:hypothetical protein